MKKYAFGVDIGGTNIVAGLMGKDGKVIWKEETLTEPEKGNDHVMDRIAALIKAGIKATGLPTDDILGVGLGMPGLIDPDQGVCIYAANLNFENFELAAEITDRTGLPAFVNNDVRMFVYGEAAHGAGRGKDFVYGLTLGTGLAAALVTGEGEIYSGGGGLAGEIGHIPHEEIPYKCNCGMQGCLEAFVSATGLARQAQDAVKSGENTILATYHNNLTDLTAADVSKAFDAGDTVAKEIMQRSGEILGKVLAHVVPVVSPDVIVIGGGVAKAGERLLAPVRETLEKNILPFYKERLKLKVAVHLEDAGVIGSAAWAFHQLESSSSASV